MRKAKLVQTPTRQLSLQPLCPKLPWRPVCRCGTIVVNRPACYAPCSSTKGWHVNGPEQWITETVQFQPIRTTRGRIDTGPVQLQFQV